MSWVIAGLPDDAVPEVNTVYEIRHSRKGTFIGRVTKVNGEFADVDVVVGKPKFMSDSYRLEYDGQVSIRDSLCYLTRIDNVIIPEIKYLTVDTDALYDYKRLNAVELSIVQYAGYPHFFGDLVAMVNEKQIIHNVTRKLLEGEAERRNRREQHESWKDGDETVEFDLLEDVYAMAKASWKLHFPDHDVLLVYSDEAVYEILDGEVRFESQNGD